MRRRFATWIDRQAAWRRMRLGALGLLGLGAATAGEASAEEPAAAASGRLNPLSTLDRAELKAFLDKPLFAPSRQAPRIAPAEPPPPVVASAAPPPEEPPNIRLTGIVEGSATPMAILERLNAKTTSTVRLGDLVDGWLVASIDAMGIKLTNGDREQEYRLFAGVSLMISGPEHAEMPQAPVRRDLLR